MVLRKLRNRILLASVFIVGYVTVYTALTACGLMARALRRPRRSASRRGPPEDDDDLDGNSGGDVYDFRRQWNTPAA